MADEAKPLITDGPRALGGLLALASGLMLAGAFYFQYVEGLQPCPLCISQRWAHAACLVVGLATAFAGRGSVAPPLLALLTLCFVASMGIAGYHVAVEQGWIESSFCGAGDVVGQTVEELKAALWETAILRCDEVPWSLAGISMAGYNMMISSLLAGVAAWSLRKTGLSRA
ncbi:MAG: disulfide bond formation protein B [Rhodospirillales bacterium]|nr:disulfide bond formation protein B [Rhodospirillales bacterium]